MRWLRRILITLLILLLLAFALGWRLLAGSRPQLDGHAALRGLTRPVTVERDARGVPTLSAHSRTDLAYALGYVHGQERFFQMDLLRRNAAGGFAALVGAAAVPVDMNHRRHRFRALALQEFAALPAQERVLIDAYRDGVNAGLDALAVRPWEYLLLGEKPKPWRSEDSLLVIDAMFLDLNADGTNKRELHLAQLRAVLPKPLVDFLTAPDPSWQAPLQGGAGAAAPMPGPEVFDLRHAKPLASADGLRAVLDATRADSGIGSNSFAVSAALTGGGGLLANDPHLSLRVPDIWYRARMRFPDPVARQHMIDLNGVTLPGVPALVIGSNGHIAWGFTNSEGDWMDWVRVLRDPHDPSRYKTPDGWATIQHHDEVIHVHGAPDQHLLVEDTIWGPIMASDTDGTPLALAWIAQNPRAANLDLMRLETEHSAYAALGLAPDLGIPPQNFVVADARGHIGWSIAGSAIPLRAGFDPSLPADWSEPGTGWTGFAMPAQDPVIVDPANGRLWTANNRLVNGDALKLLGDGGYDTGARAQQLRDDLRALKHVTPRDALGIQLDDRALFLSRWQVLLLDVLSTSRDPRALALRPYVEHWQARAAADSVGYRIVRAFHDRVRGAALAPFAARVSAKYPKFVWPSAEMGEAAAWTLVTQRPPYLLDPDYKDWNALLQGCARKVADDLQELPGPLSRHTWGEKNTAAIRNPISVALPDFLTRFIDMPRDQLPGDRDMPRVQKPDFGASMRMDVEPGREADGILEMPSGQSDNPLSPYYGAGHEDWVHGVATPLLPGPAKYSMTLVPAVH